ncbi:MAG: class I SAM-dependent methyltransferase [Alphaproteobacteria bacterium]
MIETIKKALRGRHNSLRYKFFVLPREWLIYFLAYRLRGRSWVDFYAHRLDAYVAGDANRPVSQRYLGGGQIHRDYLVAHGLLAHHRLLDFGCGMLRSGLHFIRYLDDNRYVGVDISGHRVERGIRLLSDHGIPADRFETHVVGDCRLRELTGQTFDYVWANSVVTHMPESDVRTAFRAIRGLLAPDGAFYFTFAEADRRRRMNIKDFWYTRADMQALCADCGLDFAVQEDWRDRGDVMVCARRAN